MSILYSASVTGGGHMHEVHGFYTFYLQENEHNKHKDRIQFTRTINTILDDNNLEIHNELFKPKEYHKTDLRLQNHFKKHKPENENTLIEIFPKYMISRKHLTKTKKHNLLLHKIQKHDASTETSQPSHNSRPKTSRQRRFIPFFRNDNDNDDGKFFKILDFVMKNGRKVVPIISVVREINTLVKTSNGELNHLVKERNHYVGTPPPLQPVTYNLELDNNSGLKSFLKRLLGFNQGDRLTISNTRK